MNVLFVIRRALAIQLEEQINCLLVALKAPFNELKHVRSYPLSFSKLNVNLLSTYKLLIHNFKYVSLYIYMRVYLIK